MSRNLLRRFGALNTRYCLPLISCPDEYHIMIGALLILLNLTGVHHADLTGVCHVVPKAERKERTSEWHCCLDIPSGKLIS